MTRAGNPIRFIRSLFIRCIDEVGWWFTFLVLSATIALLVGDIGDIYITGELVYPFPPLVFGLKLFVSLVAGRTLFLAARWSEGRRAARMAVFTIALMMTAATVVHGYGLSREPPLRDIAEWRASGFPGARRYPGIQRRQIEALLLVRTCLPLVPVPAAAAAVMVALSRRRGADSSPAAA